LIWSRPRDFCGVDTLKMRKLLKSLSLNAQTWS
jgi:hypothetical protein